MLILIMLVTIAGIIYSVHEYEEGWGALLILMLVIELGACGVLGVCIINGRVIDEKISMYEEENLKIETQVQTVVKEYLKHEKETFENCDAESMITLIDMYPELKSDTLVSKQIDVYVSNNEEIKNLKREKINISNYKWFVYFGK